jgi:hypothetical protein
VLPNAPGTGATSAVGSRGVRADGVTAGAGLLLAVGGLQQARGGAVVEHAAG